MNAVHGSWMEDEIRSQTEVLASNSARYFEELRQVINGRSFDLVLLVARGSSDNAALAARYLIEIHLGIPVSLAAPSVITRYSGAVRYPNCLAVGISQSGAAPDVSEVLAELRRQGHATLAITNTPSSRVTSEAEYSLLLEAGKENAVAATKTYTASVLATYQMVRALGADLPNPTLPTSEWIERSRSTAEADLTRLLRSPIVFSLARGYNFATCQETALKLIECALVPCKPYSLADFEHGPKAMAGVGSAAIVFGEPPSSLADSGTQILRAPSSGAGPASAIWDVIYGQWLALYAARARGYDPDQPERLAKVTETL
ncbi:MAG: SIS domain-containing protein [Fimbriimonadaceae bacterium]|nr:SIS domain-containing protein [Fimbriimonadaceae bacterium]